jgi:hypothetical protein
VTVDKFEIVAGVLAAFGVTVAGLPDWHAALNPATIGGFAIAVATALRALRKEPRG